MNSIWQPRFTILTLFLVTLVACVMSAGGYYLVNGLRTGWRIEVRFLVFVAAAPAIVMILASLALTVLNRPKRGK